MLKIQESDHRNREGGEPPHSSSKCKKSRSWGAPLSPQTLAPQLLEAPVARRNNQDCRYTFPRRFLLTWPSATDRKALMISPRVKNR